MTKALQRQVKAGRLAHVWRGFYVVIPLEYRQSGRLPVDWYLDDLMRFLNRRYYVGLLSAAALYGAAHQQPQVTQVVVARHIRSASIQFFQKRDMTSALTAHQKTHTGIMQVSTPAWTTLDLVRFCNRIGGLNTVVGVLSELTERLTPEGILAACQMEPEQSLSQRLGYLLDWLGRGDLTGQLAEWMDLQKPSRVRLDTTQPYRGGKLDPKWRVVGNGERE